MWTYDNAGNITSKKTYAYTTGTLGTVVSTVNYVYGNTEWGDLLTTYNGKSITYDTIGNPLSDGTWNYSWTRGRRLTTMAKSGITCTFAYCGNNPVMGYDPIGHWDWGIFWEVVANFVSATISIGVGIATTAVTGNPIIGTVAGVATFGAINNIVNFSYYTFISNGSADIEKNTVNSTYTDRYVSRWERLDYTRHQVEETWYSPNAWRYHSEYSLHMYGWYAIGWAEGKGIPALSNWANSFRKAEVDSTSADPRPLVAVFSILWGVLGL